MSSYDYSFFASFRLCKNRVDTIVQSNSSFAAPSLVQVDVGSNQASTDPSGAFHRNDLGSGGGLQEPVLAESVTPSYFLISLRAAGITVPQGLVIRG